MAATMRRAVRRGAEGAFGTAGRRRCSASTPKDPSANPAAQAGGGAGGKAFRDELQKKRVSMVPAAKASRRCSRLSRLGSSTPTAEPMSGPSTATTGTSVSRMASPLLAYILAGRQNDVAFGEKVCYNGSRSPHRGRNACRRPPGIAGWARRSEAARRRRRRCRPAGGPAPGRIPEKEKIICRNRHLSLWPRGWAAATAGWKQAEPVGPHGELIIDYSIHDAMKAGLAGSSASSKPEKPGRSSRSASVGDIPRPR